ncbi:O-antigen ligase family protein [Luteolibacter algae]|uniref:O-antigen ligase family protein n=1 Tax=Luteolibacter algae TaxID=454151 RepID=A0ABW5D930_9BACT
MSYKEQEIADAHRSLIPDRSHPFIFWALLFLTIAGTFISAAPWAMRTGALFLGCGLLVIAFPRIVPLPRPWIFLAGGMLLAGLAPFLPAAWFPIPEWRDGLEKLGVDTGTLVAIQWRQAAEQYVILSLVFLAGLWIAGQRASSSQLRNIAMAFTWAVALYAIFAVLLRSHLPVHTYGDHFGFFPNRNHSGTLLAMGAVCGSGAAFQAIRQKQLWRILAAFAAVGVCLWAAFVWSISRSGIILSGMGFSLWIALLGFKYFQRGQRKALGLVLLAAIGVYFIAESKVKNRIAETIDKANVAGETLDANDLQAEDSAGLVKYKDVDFRVPVALDTFEMIADAPLTGVGGGQYRHIFPQYRHYSSIVNHAEAVHPESSWLWWAAEFGLPATLLLAAFVILLFVQAVRNIRQPKGRDRAIRFGCLAAAAVVPLHCFFDVPAHRTPLVWAAVLLFALSLNPPQNLSRKRPNHLFTLATGLALIAVGIRLLGAEFSNFAVPYTTHADHARASGAQRYDGLAELTAKDMFTGLEERGEIADEASQSIAIAPLENRLYRLRALSLLPIESQRQQVLDDFEIDRSLQPFSIRIPQIQSKALLAYDKIEAESILREALERKARVEAVRDGKPR